MQANTATWDFIRSQSGVRSVQPLGLDALHALQDWRAGHAGRDFRLARTSPFQWTDQLRAQLSHLSQDERAGADLCLSCSQHKIHASAQDGHGEQRGAATLSAHAAQALGKLGGFDAPLAERHESTRRERRKQHR